MLLDHKLILLKNLKLQTVTDLFPLIWLKCLQDLYFLQSLVELVPSHHGASLDNIIKGVSVQDKTRAWLQGNHGGCSRRVVHEGQLSKYITCLVGQELLDNLLVFLIFGLSITSQGTCLDNEKLLSILPLFDHKVVFFELSHINCLDNNIQGFFIKSFEHEGPYKNGR